jgi:large subunit ribosomal protein L25
MVQAELNVEVREASGKGVARKLRSAGLIPAVVYGKEIESLAITVDPKALEKAMGNDINTLITLKGAAAVDGQVVILKDADYHPIKRDMICADFQTISLKEKSTFMIAINVIGPAAGEKEGGTLQLIRHELEVLCLPTAVPHAIDLDVTALQIGDNIHIEDVVAPEGVELVYDNNFTVATVASGLMAEEEEDTEAEEDAATTEESDAAAE